MPSQLRSTWALCAAAALGVALPGSGAMAAARSPHCLAAIEHRSEAGAHTRLFRDDRLIACGPTVMDVGVTNAAGR